MAELAAGEGLLREFFAAATADIAGFLAPGSATAAVLAKHLALLCAGALGTTLKRRNQREQQRSIDAMIQVGIGKSTAIAREELDRWRFPAEIREQLVGYFSAIPMTARSAISRPNDGGHPTTLLSQLPRSQGDLIRFMPLRPPHFRPGEQVPGQDYRLERLLGQGGFAEVWKAGHIIQKAHPPVAIKFCVDPGLAMSLATEMAVYDVLARHPHPEYIVRLVSTGYSANPPFLVYDFVDGGDLAAWVASFDGKLPSARHVVRVLKMAARAMAFAHANGIVHRDLKPSNILVTRAGRIRVSDFGIGAVLAEAEAMREATETAGTASRMRAAYTPIYADPRQRRGEAAVPGFDILSLGVVVYQLLMGDVTREMGPAWRTELEEAGVPANVVTLVAGCVEVPAKRFADAGALLAAIDALEPARRKPPPTNPGIIHCTECGARAGPGDQYCIHCGMRLD